MEGEEAMPENAAVEAAEVEPELDAGLLNQVL